MLLRDFITTLSPLDREACINDYATLEQDGCVGECQLRFTANQYAKSEGIKDYSIIMMMRDVVFEIYRLYYHNGELV
jgi:hypothetical protein